jgi:hypothetical protein
MTATLRADEIGCHCWHAIELSVGPAIFDRDVAAFGEAQFA